MIFHLNVFLPFIAFLIIFFVWTYIISMGKFDKLNRAIILYLSSIMIYSLLVFYIRLANDLENNIFLLKLIPITYLPIGVLFLNFIYHLLSKKRDAILWGFSLIVWISAGINLFTDIFVTKFIQSEWGYHLQSSHPYSFNCTFIAIYIPALIGLYYLAKEIYQNSNSPYQSQIKWIIGGTGFIWIVVLLSEYMIFNYELYETIRLGPIALATVALFILPSVIKYNFITPSKREISTKLFSSLPDAVFLIDENGIILESNKSAKNIIESTKLSHIEELTADHLFINYSHKQNYTDYISVLLFNQSISISISQNDYKEFGFKMGKLLIVKDISAVLLSEQRLRQAQEVSHTGSFQYDLITEKVTWSKELYHIYQKDSQTYYPTNEGFFSEILHPDDKNRIEELVNKNLMSGKPFEYNHRIKLSNNEERIMNCRCIITLNDENLPICIDGTVQDITELENARMELLESENKYRILFEESPDAILIHDDLNIYYCNTSAVKLCRLNSTKELQSLNIKKFFSDEYFEDLQLQIKNYIAGEHIEIKNQEIILPNGNTLYIDALGVRTHFNGKPVIQTSIRDVTDRVIAEQELRESEIRYRHIIENSTDIIFNTNIEGELTFANSVFESISGYSETEVLRKDINILVESSYQEKIKKEYNDFFKSPDNNLITSVSAITKTGKRIWLELNINKINEGKYVLGFTTIARNITERKKIEKALAESEEKYRILVENSTEMIYEIDVDGNYTFVNRVMIKNMGYSKEKILTMNCFDTIVKEHRANAHVFYSKQIKTKKKIAFYELPCFGKDKKVYWISQMSRLNSDKNGRPIGFSVTARNITDEHNSELELKNSEKRYKELYETAPAGYLNISTKGKILSCNNMMTQILGYELAELIDKPVIEFYADNDMGKPRAKVIIEKILEGKSTVNEELQMLKKDGTTCWIDLTVYPIKNEKGEVLESQSMVVDINDRKFIQRAIESSRLQMLQAQNIAQLGSWEWDISQNIVSWSDNLYSLYGTDLNSFQVTFESFISRVHNEDREFVSNSITECMKTQIPMDYYHRTIPINGVIKTMHCNGIIIADKEGSPLTLVGTAQDVTKEVEAEQALKDSEKRLANAQEIAHFGNWEEDHKTGAIHWSDECKKIFGFEKINKITQGQFWEIVHPEDLEKLKDTWTELEKTFQAHEGTFRIILKDGFIRHVREKSNFILDDDGKLKITIGTVQDITEIEESNIQLENSQLRLKQAQQLALIGNWEFDDTTGKTYWSDECKRIFGFDIENEIDYNAYWSKIHPDDQNWLLDLWKKSKISLNPYKVVYRAIINNEIKYLRESTEFTSNSSGGLYKCLGTIQDITSEKEADVEIKESHKKLRELSEHLQTIQEDERAHIAREIHDELGQRLTGIKMDLAWIKGKMSTDDKNLLKRMSALNELIDDTIQSVREISSELHPVILDDLGLKAAMEWQISEFTRRSKVKCNLQVDEKDVKFDKIQSKVIFRIMQESLTNILRHAKAKHVDIIIIQNKDHITLTINDDGIGMEDIDETTHNSFGILGMKERAFSVGGSLSILSGIDKGTNIVLNIPIDKKQS